MTTVDPQLAAMRASIDNLDAALIFLLAERFKQTRKVGELKARTSLPPADPVREAEQVARLRTLAAESGLDPVFAEKLLAFIVAEVIRHHEAIAAGVEVSVAIAAPAAVVAAYAGDPANLPAWAVGLAGGVEQVGDAWWADSPMGRVQVRFVGDVAGGVLDHEVVLPSGERVLNPMRVLPDGAGCRVAFTVTSGDESDRAAVAADLARLAAIVVGSR